MIQYVKQLSSARLHAAVLASGLALTVVGAPAPAPAPAAPEEPQQIKSVFVDRPNFGRDPFFPNSTRRGRLIETNRVEVVANFSNIVLKGISGGASEKRLAIINNKTFEVGEEGDLRVSGHPVKVKCVEIREKSILISINGVTKELFLDAKF